MIVRKGVATGRSCGLAAPGAPRFDSVAPDTPSGTCTWSARLPAGEAQQPILQRSVLGDVDGPTEDAHLAPLLRLGGDPSPRAPRTRSSGSVVSAPMNLAMS